MGMGQKNRDLFPDKIELLESTLDSTIDGVVVLDTDFNVLFINKTVEKWTGKKKDEILGKHCRKVAPSLNCDEVCPPKKTFEDGQSHVSENKITTADGVEIFQLVSSSPLKNDSGEIVGCVEVIKDVTERKRSEAALKESEEKFRTLAEESPNMIFINKGGRVVFVNQRCEEIMGYSREEFFAGDFNLMRIIAPESRELVKNNMKRHLKGEEIPPYEYRLLTKDGKEIIGIHTTKLIDYEGERAILGIFTDISSRKKAEESLKESEERFRKVFEEGLVGIALADSDYHFIRANQLFCKMFGYSESELRELTFKDITHPDYVVSSVEDAANVSSGGQSQKREKIYIKKNGEQMWGEVTVSAVRNEKGEFLYFMAMVEDITERKEAERKLKESENYLTGIIENSGDAIITTDSDGKISLWSRGAENLYGYRSEEVLGKWVDFLYPQELKKEREEWQNRILNGETIRNIRTRIYNSNGKLIDINLTLSPLLDKDGKSKGTIGVSKDITNVIKAEKQLQEKIEELEKWQRLTVGRESRMVELKNEIEKLKERLLKYE